jgi:hypothetical protein
MQRIQHVNEFTTAKLMFKRDLGLSPDRCGKSLFFTGAGGKEQRKILTLSATRARE